MNPVRLPVSDLPAPAHHARSLLAGIPAQPATRSVAILFVVGLVAFARRPDMVVRPQF